MKVPFKEPKKPTKGMFKMNNPEVALNLQPDGFKPPKRQVRQHRRF